MQSTTLLYSFVVYSINGGVKIFYACFFLHMGMLFLKFGGLIYDGGEEIKTHVFKEDY
jgi:hypothetical protein